MNKPKLSCLFSAIIAVLFLIISVQAFAFTPKEIYQKVGSGVVLILASEGSRMGSVGTGSIIREDGLIITNAHIFTRENSSRLKPDIAIFLKPARVTGNHKKDLSQRYKGKIVSYDMPLDLALLKIVEMDHNKPLARVDFADSENVVIGDKVYAIGHPEQGGLWSLTTGVISAFRQDHGGVAGKNLFQTDASINRGNSGGPLLDENGVMVGINSMIARKAKDGLTITDVNFSIQSNVALKWLNSLGYHFTAKRETAAVTPKPKYEESVVQPKETVPTPKIEPEKEKEVPSKPGEAVVTTPKPVKEKPVPPPLAKPAKPEDKPKVMGTDKILTKKKPYKMTKLLRDMQEMEDMMDDMKEKVRKYKEKKY